MGSDPATMGGWARLVSKLPSIRGISNWLYVSANWSRISDELETYRRQIKDREEWAKTALAQQDELHRLALQRAYEELAAWRDLTAKVSEQRDNSAAMIERALAGLEQAKKIIEDRDGVIVDCTMLLAVLLRSEPPHLREALTKHLPGATVKVVNFVVAEIDRRIAKGELPPPPEAK